MKINNLDNYEVAAINYPLMDPRIKSEDFVDYFQLGYNNHDPFEVPIYVHIPFCTSICSFCIYSRQVPDQKGDILSRYVEALKREIEIYSRTAYVSSMKIGAVFFGGGTPSCLSGTQIAEIIKGIRDFLPLKDDVEITMECNITSADEIKMEMMKRAGISRISTGIQTFNPKFREMFGMVSSAEEIFRWIEMTEKYLFKELSLDLLYGLPGQNCDEWIKDLETALSLPVGHLSIYKLAVFAYTKLYKDINSQLVPELPDSKSVLEMFLEASKILREAHFHLQSNQEYGKEGTDAGFWRLTYDGYGDNLSFGAFSFGFINGFSYQNYPDPREYIQHLAERKLPVKMVSRKITVEQAMERTMLLSCRGGNINKELFYSSFGKKPEDVFYDDIEGLIQQKLLTESEKYYHITDHGCFYQGDISAKFMKSTFRDVSKMKKKMAIGMHIIPEAI